MRSLIFVLTVQNTSPIKPAVRKGQWSHALCQFYSLLQNILVTKATYPILLLFTRNRMLQWGINFHFVSKFLNRFLNRACGGEALKPYLNVSKKVPFRSIGKSRGKYSSMDCKARSWIKYGNFPSTPNLLISVIETIFYGNFLNNPYYIV